MGNESTQLYYGYLIIMVNSKKLLLYGGAAVVAALLLSKKAQAAPISVSSKTQPQASQTSAMGASSSSSTSESNVPSDTRVLPKSKLERRSKIKGFFKTAWDFVLGRSDWYKDSIIAENRLTQIPVSSTVAQSLITVPPLKHNVLHQRSSNSSSLSASSSVVSSDIVFPGSGSLGNTTSNSTFADPNGFTGSGTRLGDTGRWFLTTPLGLTVVSVGAALTASAIGLLVWGMRRRTRLGRYVELEAGGYGVAGLAAVGVAAESTGLIHGPHSGPTSSTPPSALSSSRITPPPPPINRAPYTPVRDAAQTAPGVPSLSGLSTGGYQSAPYHPAPVVGGGGPVSAFLGGSQSSGWGATAFLAGWFKKA